MCAQARSLSRLEEGRVKVAEGLRGWAELRKELLALDGNGRKSRGQDDLAMGLALACGAWRALLRCGMAGWCDRSERPWLNPLL